MRRSEAEVRVLRKHCADRNTTSTDGKPANMIPIDYAAVGGLVAIVVNHPGNPSEAMS